MKRLYLVMILAILATGCENVRNSFRRDVPDEFKVHSRAALIIPDDTKTLPEPGSDTDFTMDSRHITEAKQALIGRASVKSGAAASLTEGDQAFLAEFNIDYKAAENIRETMDAERAQWIKDNSRLLDGIMSWQTRENPFDIPLYDDQFDTE